MNVLATAAAAGGPGTLPSLLAFFAAVLAYFIPAIVAWLRHVPGKGSVTVVNVFLGWTVIGWIVALAMACRSRPQPVEPVTRSTAA